jgi:2-amino-4-hydroxy-6-hydroxymethyldihydropteridine diphosphokinase
LNTLVYLGLGSNQGDSPAILAGALEELSHFGCITAVSSLYLTQAQDLPEQADFYNAVVAIRTDLRPLALLHLIGIIESDFQRRRTIPKGPRTLDIDILLYGNQEYNLPNLTIPHPAMLKRAFVLVPLAEIAPNLQLGKPPRPLSYYQVDLDSQGIYARYAFNYNSAQLCNKHPWNIKIPSPVMPST